jgi:hypothetical protein
MSWLDRFKRRWLGRDSGESDDRSTAHKPVSGCGHVDFPDMRCGIRADVFCCLCGQGRCASGWHLYSRFGTTIGGTPWELDQPAGKWLWYWCESCGGPVCTACVGVEVDYPCPVAEVETYPFVCAGCGAVLQVLKCDGVSLRAAAEILIQRTLRGVTSLAAFKGHTNC